MNASSLSLAWMRRARVTADAIAPALNVVSPFGWGVVAGVVVLWLAGAVLGWSELVAIGVVSLSIVVCAIVFVLGRSAYDVTVDLAHNRVVVGARAVGRVEVRNHSHHALLPSRIELPVGAALATFALPRMSAGSTHEELFTVPTNRRGVLTIGPVRSVRDDPFGLLRRYVVWTEPAALFVHPSTVRLDGSSSGFIRDLEGLPTKNLSANDVSFHALRAYVPGDDRRHIHWKSTARTGEVMVRQFEETRRSHLAIALSTSAREYLNSDEFELAVSACGSLGMQAIKEEKKFSVLVHGGALQAGSAPRLLDSLSAVDTGQRAEGVVQLAMATTNAVPDASVVILIGGSDVESTLLRRASMTLPLGATAVAVRCAPGAPVSRRKIGELTVLTIGSLDALPAAMRRVAG